MCSSLNPVFKKHTCESAALVFNNTQNCRYTHADQRNHLIRINIDTFMIVPFVRAHIDMICENGTSVSHSFQTNKILKIEPGCIIENEEFRVELGASNYENITIPIFGDINLDFYNSTNDFLDFNNTLLEI